MFKLQSNFVPTGDQPEAIRQLCESIRQGLPYQTLLGVTGSGKTFTMANVVQEIQRPTLVLSHNKTLAAQLYGEFKNFFPENAVEYYVSYYDYYQPEAYLPTTDTYIEKDLSINAEIEKLRLSATTSLLSGRSDVIIVSSVSCIYGIGNPEDFNKTLVDIKKGQFLDRNVFLRKLVDILYSRNEIDLKHGNFRVKGDTVDVFLAYADTILRVVFWGNQIEEILMLDPMTNRTVSSLDSYRIFPANLFVTSKERIASGIEQILQDLEKQVQFFISIGKMYEAKRLQERVTYDVEMIKELGYCSGIENYSRYFDGREPGDRPFCLLDFFPDNFLMILDESHVTLPQLRAMWGGDRARKQNLVEYGFRLPAAIDNRPLSFEEFEEVQKQIIYVSATPGDYELEKSEGVVVEQLIRPTGLIDPEIVVKPSKHQVDDLMEEIQIRIEKKQRVLVTTLTKRMAEELSSYMDGLGIRCSYIHSDVDTMDRVRILEDLRKGVYDVLVGVNLLREGLDLPEVSLVAILDADKEGFLRNHRSLTQTSGRAARHLEGKVIMYADKMTKSMKMTIDETNRRRAKQMAYNELHGIIPTAIVKDFNNSIVTAVQQTEPQAYIEPTTVSVAADPILRNMSQVQLRKAMDKAKKSMKEAAKRLDFLEAAQYRDEALRLEALLLGENNSPVEN